MSEFKVGDYVEQIPVNGKVSVINGLGRVAMISENGYLISSGKSGWWLSFEKAHEYRLRTPNTMSFRQFIKKTMEMLLS